jgi:hypothetical protein
MDTQTANEISATIMEIVIDVAPDATTRAMYGGTVIEMEPNNPKTRIGGVYVYTDYVSLELANGAAFDDPDGVLEGSGKKRRHVKMRQVDDVEAKGCRGFLELATSQIT